MGGAKFVFEDKASFDAALQRVNRLNLNLNAEELIAEEPALTIKVSTIHNGKKMPNFKALLEAVRTAGSPNEIGLSKATLFTDEPRQEQRYKKIDDPEVIAKFEKVVKNNPQRFMGFDEWEEEDAEYMRLKINKFKERFSIETVMADRDGSVTEYNGKYLFSFDSDRYRCAGTITFNKELTKYKISH